MVLFIRRTSWCEAQRYNGPLPGDLTGLTEGLVAVDGADVGLNQAALQRHRGDAAELRAV
jgi:hypothetical protein